MYVVDVICEVNLLVLIAVRLALHAPCITCLPQSLTVWTWRRISVTLKPKESQQLFTVDCKQNLGITNNKMHNHFLTVFTDTVSCYKGIFGSAPFSLKYRTEGTTLGVLVFFFRKRPVWQKGCF